MLTALVSRGLIGARFGWVKESELAISLLFSRGVRFFLGDVRPFRMVLTGDLDLKRIRFLDVSLGIAKLPATKNFAGRLFLLLALSVCFPGGGRGGVISMSAS